MHNKTIRSFVRREGRLTKAQERSIEELLPVYGLSLSEELLDFEKIFGRESDVVVEIGFGMGSTLLEMAQVAPEKDFIGIEVHRPGVGWFLNAIHEVGLKNIRVMTDDAVTILKQMIPDNSLDTIQIYFPDPWPKKRHHKRRIIQPDFIALLHAKLKSEGILHLATDWKPYAEWMMEMLTATKEFNNIAGEKQYSKRPAWRPISKFERRGTKLGHEVFDLIFHKSRC